MHELGVARDIVRRACAEAAGARAARVSRLVVEVGPDGDCEPLALQLSLQAAGERTALAGADVRVRRAAAGGVVLRSLDLDFDGDDPPATG